MIDLRNWKRSVELELGRLRSIDFGYPLGDNVVFPPVEHARVTDVLVKEFETEPFFAEFEEFFGVCNGLSMPDVHNGYFVHSVFDLCAERHLSKSLPVALTGVETGEIRVFGSDGGGGLFAIRFGSGEVLYLSAGKVSSGEFYATQNSLSIVAASFGSFLLRFLEDLEAFISNRDQHNFMV